MEKYLFDNGFFEFVHSEEDFIIDGNTKRIKRNFVRRPPGIRALIVDKESKKILFSREFRYELNDWDLRLPGGKVFDSLDDYKRSLETAIASINIVEPDIYKKMLNLYKSE